MATASEAPYDYVVVGAGACGAVVASRLAAANLNLRVLLLEAGNDHRPAEMSRAMASRNPMELWGDASLTWSALEVRRTPVQCARAYPAGKCVGGGSSVNGMGWIFAQPSDFDLGWPRSTWGWEERMQRTHRQMETDPLHEGTTGPIIVSRTDPGTEWGSVSSATKEAAMRDLGLAWSPDLNDGVSTGVSPFPLNWDPTMSRRSSVNEVYLEPHRDKITVVPATVAQRLLFDDGRCCGVETASATAAAGAETTAYYATHEVIVCAGAIFTPALLQRSGIGPRALLEGLGIPCRLDRPVGETLQDHPVINGILPLREPAARSTDARHANCLVRFSSGAEAEAYGHNDLYFVTVDACNDPRLAGTAGEHKGFVDVMLMHCTSRGTVALDAASRDDPRVPPIVSLNLLATEQDRTRMRRGARTLARLLQSTCYDAICVPGMPRTLGREGDGTPTEPEAILAMDDGALDAWMLANASDGIHVSCSCAMGVGVGGAEAEADAVTDARGRVLSGLRVCDASAMPEVPRANTHATSVALAEGMAQLVLEEHAAAVRREEGQGPRVHRLSMFGAATRQRVAEWLFGEWEREIRASDGIESAAALADSLSVEDDFLTLVAVESGGGGGGGRVVGTARLAVRDLASHDAHCTPWLAAVFVPEEARGRGVGRRVVRGVMDRARARGHDTLFLWYPTTKAAALGPLYASLGFEELERTRNDASSFGEDIVVMRAAL